MGGERSTRYDEIFRWPLINANIKGVYTEDSLYCIVMCLLSRYREIFIVFGVMFIFIGKSRKSDHDFYPARVNTRNSFCPSIQLE